MVVTWMAWPIRCDDPFPKTKAWFSTSTIIIPASVFLQYNGSRKACQLQPPPRPKKCNYHPNRPDCSAPRELKVKDSMHSFQRILADVREIFRREVSFPRSPQDSILRTCKNPSPTMMAGIKESQLPDLDSRSTMQNSLLNNIQH